MTTTNASVESYQADSDGDIDLHFSGRLEVPIEISMLGVRSIRRVLIRYHYTPSWEHFDRTGNVHEETNIDLLLASSSFFTREGVAKQFDLFDDGSTDEALWDKVRELIDRAAKKEDAERRQS